MIPPLVARGYRVVAPDLIGFGRSDKPGRTGDYSYARMVGWLGELAFGVLGLGGSDGQRLTLVCQDWGGLLGLRLVAAAPHRFARVATANTFLPTGRTPMPDAFRRWVKYSQTAPTLDAGRIVSAGCSRHVPEDALAAYSAPFRVESVPDGLDPAAGMRILPALVPASADAPGAAENVAAWSVLERFQRPWLCAFSDEDPITGGADRIIRARVPGTALADGFHVTIEGAGHFLQEDAGEELAEAVIRFVEGTCPPAVALAPPPALQRQSRL